MNLAELKDYRARQRRALMKNRVLLAVLAVSLCALWVWAGQGVTPQERSLMESVRTAQNYLYERRIASGCEFERQDDPHATGFIGLEWSPLSTTLGALGAKRTACDPRWSVVIRRWMERLGLQRGDTVAVFSSSSFPGMAFNVLRALESLGLQPLLVVSLGASTWGANDPKFSWPVMSRELRSAGFLRTREFAFTPGGGRETGGGLPPEALELMSAEAAKDSVPFVVKNSLEEVIQWKMELIEQFRVKAVISIGGSEANMGNAPDILSLRPGLHTSGRGGDGVVGRALERGYPVVHLLNIKGLAAAEGIPFDSAPGVSFNSVRSVPAACAALALFVCVLCLYRRWSF
ncbi:MAG: poly-gamma-glutamate system protein [Pyramidobacter sp.]|nr:poly-gamma-glutamate system protein [Pyramidobacter sp.]